MRGIYTAGILDMLLEDNIKIDAVVGVSAGALFGINYVSKQKGRCLKYNLDYIHDKNYMGIYSFLKTGNIMNQDTCFQKIVYESHPFDFDTFQKSNVDFYSVVTNLETGRAEYVLIKDLKKDMEYLRASGSMPLVSKNVEINGKKYLDGAIADSIPYQWAKENGYDKIIVIETRVKDYRKKKSSVLPYKIKYSKYPNFLSSISNRWSMYNQEKEMIQEDEKLGKAFVFRPSELLPIKRIEKNPKMVQKMYDLGVKDFQNKKKSLLEFLTGE